MNKIYSIVINFYNLLILSLSPFNQKASRWINGRKEWESELGKKIGKGKNWIWFHCSSLGEFEDSCEVFFKIKHANPTKKTLLTVFSPSAFEALEHSGLFDAISYLPIDTKTNAKVFVEIVKPELVLFSRSELWYNFLFEIRAREIPLFLISLKLNHRSNFIPWPVRNFYKKCFNTFTTIYCQNFETQQLLNSHFGITNTLITGNTRFERVYNQFQRNESFPDIEKFASGHSVIVMGSCLPKDERIFLQIYDDLKGRGLKWIIVPHEIEKSTIARKINPKFAILYSNIEALNEFHDILIIDSVGILKHIYRYANFALIGGGFDKIGIHNIIEPAAHGIQMAFGPNHRNYDEAIELLRLGGATIYKNGTELKDLIIRKLSNSENLALGESIKNFVKAESLGSETIAKSIQSKFLG